MPRLCVGTAHTSANARAQGLGDLMSWALPEHKGPQNGNDKIWGKVVTESVGERGLAVS